MKRHFFLNLAAFLSFMLMFSALVLGQDNAEVQSKLKTAQQMIAALNFIDAESIYTDLLRKYPNHTAVLSAQESLRFRQKKYFEDKPKADLNSEKEESNKQTDSSDSYKPKIDFTLLGGHTSSKFAGIATRENSTGVRFAEIAVEPTRNSRVWFQYDNGLSLDSFALARSNRQVPTYFVGGLVNYKKYYLTKFAFGWRNLDNNVKQKLYDIEQVFFLPKGYSFDAGVVIAPRSDNRTETVFHTGVSIPVKERFRLHPTFFYATSGVPGEKQARGLLAAEYKFENGIKIDAGFAAGREFRPAPLGKRTITDTYGRFSFPLGKYIRPQFLIRHEAIGNSSNTIFTFGFTISNKEVK